VRLRVSIDKDALTIPDVAVQRGPSGLFVFVVSDDNHATPRPVTLAHEDANVAIIDKGLNEGERVVTAGQFGPAARLARRHRRPLWPAGAEAMNGGVFGPLYPSSASPPRC